MRSLTLMTLFMIACDTSGSEEGSDDTGLGLETGECEDEEDGDEPAEVLDCAALQEGATLTDDPERKVDYQIDCVATINGALAIEPGVVIAFAEDAGLKVDGTGVIEAIGDECDPIRLIGLDPTPGSWKGLLVQNDELVDNLLEHVEIRHAGGSAFNSNGDLGAIVLWAESALTLRDATISDSASYGINATYSASELSVEGESRITGSALAPALIKPDLASGFHSTSHFTGNADDYILVTEGEISGDHSWQPLDVPYRITSTNEIFYDIVVSEGSTLTLEAGVEVHGEPLTGLEIVGGSFITAGTEDDRVVLRSADGTPGGWKGLYLARDYVEANPTFSLSYTDLLHGGGGAFNSNGDLGNLVIWYGTDVTLSDVRIAEGASYGINATYGETRFTMEGTNEITGNALAPALVETNLASDFSGASTYVGNGADHILVAEGGLDGSHSWQALDVPYRLTSLTEIFYEVVVPEGASLVLEEGVEIEAEEDTGIEVSGGSFSSEGTDEDPVVMWGAEAGAGYWKGLFFDAEEGGSFSTNHTEIHQAGGGAFNSNGDLGALVVWAESAVAINDTTFSEVGSDCAINLPYNDDDVSGAGNTVADGSAALICDPD